jgi:hypothetical protein
VRFLARSAVVLMLAGLLMSPSSALAAGPAANPLAPFTPTPAPVPTTTAPTTVLTPTQTQASGGSSLSGTNAILIAIGALVLIGGISFFIWYDARRRAPIRHRAAAATAGGGSRAGSKAKGKPRKLSAAERKRRKRGRAR